MAVVSWWSAAGVLGFSWWSPGCGRPGGPGSRRRLDRRGDLSLFGDLSLLKPDEHFFSQLSNSTSSRLRSGHDLTTCNASSALTHTLLHPETLQSES